MKPEANVNGFAEVDPVTGEGVAPALIDDIGNHPGAYYVNIHTGRFPGGAIRGNLERD